jgi:hypothetical protein
MKFRFCLLLFFLVTLSSAQTLIGLWEVKQVLVGGDSLTPQAKWIEFKELGFTTGNGFLQNGAGTYTWSASGESLKMNDTLGLVDELDPFKVVMQGDSLNLERMEDGVMVQVFCQKVDSKPLRLADKLIGVWELEEEQTGHYYIQIRWDRKYKIVFKNGRESVGTWHMDAHKPQFTLRAQDAKAKPRIWEIETGPWQTLKLRSLANPKELILFKRLRTTPF